MIKFFRKIRQKMLAKNKFSKYLIYAIGEIVLVVIGIMIAISINNWNDNNQQIQKEIIYLREIQESLKYDLNNEIIPSIANYKKAIRSDSLLEHNFYQNKSKMSQDSIRRLYVNIGITWKVLINTVAFDNIKSIGVDLISNDSLRKKLSNLYGFDYVYLMKLQNRSDKYFIEQFQPTWGNEVGEWGKYSVKTLSQLEAIRGNDRVRSRIKSMRYHTNAKLNWLMHLKPKVEQIIADIQENIVRLEDD